jgi:hypothetical protein
MDERPGQRHTILFIPHSINRIWRTFMLLDIVIWATWWFAPYGASAFAPPNDRYLLLAGVFFFVIVLFFFMIRNWGYVQAYPNYVKVVVPFYNLKISYRFIESVRMTEFRRLFVYKELSWGNKRFLRPYFKETVATLFLIRDYLRFNTEVDSRLVAYRDKALAKATRKNAFIFDE